MYMECVHEKCTVSLIYVVCECVQLVYMEYVHENYIVYLIGHLVVGCKCEMTPRILGTGVTPSVM